ncbi:MAG: nucleotide exchange factor GrpE [Candidatus Zhuqueibacterota bacterium]
MEQKKPKESYEIKETEEHDESTAGAEKTVNDENAGNGAVKQALVDQKSSEEKYIEQLQRLQAEFANYKKRTDRERLELSNIYKSELVISLLPAIDDFERFFNHAHGWEEDLIAGVKLIYQKLMESLKVQGLTSVSTVGEKFDPEIHEAISVQEVEDGEDDVVAEEWRKGYKFNEKIIRPAQVKVVKTGKGEKN